MDNAFAQVMSIFAGIITLAIIAVLVSKNATTPQIISTYFRGFANSLSIAEGPITNGAGGIYGSIGTSFQG